MKKYLDEDIRIDQTTKTDSEKPFLNSTYGYIWVIEIKNQYCPFLQPTYEYHNCFHFKNQTSICAKKKCPIKAKDKN